MWDPLDFENRQLAARIEHKRKLTALIMTTERLTGALWRLLSWAMLFCGLWMFNIPAMFGPAMSAGATLIFATGFLYLLYSDFRTLRLPRADEISRRIEKDSGVRHRPLSALKDKLANPEKLDTRTLWNTSRENIISVLPQLKTGKLRAFMARRDPYAMRLGVLMFFALGIIVAGPAWDERIWNGLTPLSFSAEEKAVSDVTLWITPPEYTGLAPMVLQDKTEQNQTLQVPAQSVLKVRVHGGLGQPFLYIDEQKFPLEYSGEDSHILEMQMREGQKLRIKQMMLTRASWNYVLAHDTPPSISLREEPEVLPNGPVRFPLTVQDDYGVQTLTLSMTLGEVGGDFPIGENVQETRSIMSPAKTPFDIQPVYDLTAHTWAGLPVIFEFTARDHLEQQAAADPISMVLPERTFTHPVAKALIALRKKLAWHPENDYHELSQELEELLILPEAYQHDLVVFLALRTAASRLYYQTPSTDVAREVIALLWDTALRVEDGNLTLAARNLRDAQMALENALQNPDITENEIAMLMNELRQAMAEYFMELHKEMQKRMAEGGKMPMIPPEMIDEMISPEALSSFLDQLESQLLSGDTNSAQEMLSQLQRMLDMMDPSIAGPMPMDMEMMSEGINELQELIDRQEELLKQTQKQADIIETFKSFAKSYGQTLPPDVDILEEWGVENMPPPPGREKQENITPIINTQTNMAEQEALRYILGQLMLEAGEVLDDIPENLGLAEQEMRGSSDALGENQPGLSVPHQEKALEHLKEAQQQLSQQLIARMQQMTGFALGSSGMRYDPLGRPYGGHGQENGQFPGSSVKIPDEAERKRVEEILRLLRRRSGELDRPDVELEYYRRLLKQF